MERKTHPSWGCIKISKIHSAPKGTRLFKSRVAHRMLFELTISSVYEVVDYPIAGHLAEDKQLISVYLSPLQFMELLMQAQEEHRFTPCTLHWVDGEYVEEETPPEYFDDKYGSVFRENAQSILSEMQTIIDRLQVMVEQKTIRKRDIKAILTMQEHVYGTLGGSLPYIINAFYENMNKEYEANKVLSVLIKEDINEQEGRE